MIENGVSSSSDFLSHARLSDSAENVIHMSFTTQKS